MRIYTEPSIELLLFDEEEILTVSGNQKTYASYELNDVLFGVGMKRTTTITLDDVKIN